jgi:hypothetical protein
MWRCRLRQPRHSLNIKQRQLGEKNIIDKQNKKIHTKISRHAFFVIRSTMIASKGVEDASRRSEALREIPENVDVKAVLALQIQ